MMLQRLTTTGFSLRLNIGDSKDIFDNIGQNKILDITMETSIFKANPRLIVADPFLFVKGSILYLFYEEQLGYQYGVLKMIKTNNLKDWSTPITVLAENFHLSFPFVFEEDGEIYMIPETGQDKSIRLYKANDDLTKWNFVDKLLDGHDYADSSIHKENGILYLFTTKIVKGQYIQELYISNSLRNGTFEKHPQSPITTNRKYARNAGSIFRYQDMLLRPTQDCSSSYGENISIMQITELSPNDYQEKLYRDNIINKTNTFYKYGGHQFNMQILSDGRTIIASDAKKRNYNIPVFCQRISNKFKSFIKK